MKARTMEQGVGLAVTRLLNYAAGRGWNLTVSPIQVEAGTEVSVWWLVTLYACLANGNDVQVRLDVDSVGEITGARFRSWDAEAQDMGAWLPAKTDEIR